jgi:epoxyqueuosine reductase
MCCINFTWRSGRSGREVKGAIRQRALELGFDACRFTTAESPGTSAEFKRWLAARYHGEMAYLERTAHKRLEPQLMLPDARSIIALALSYESSEFKVEGSKADEGTTANLPSAVRPPTCRGLIARYARFADYHHVAGERLKVLTALVNQLGGSGTRSLCYIDTGPFLERDLAQRAGLGFMGKHTNLISRDLGNWIFLAEIITTLDLQPDAPEKNRCGSCARCLTACPTQAITAPFQLDARRCISYLTIELKGSIPLELRAAMGNRIYGCDDCLAVCPWNRFAKEGNLMRQHLRPDLGSPELTGLLALDEAGFKRRFAGTPMLRAKRRGFLRNVCVALGNVGDAGALPALRGAAGFRTAHPRTRSMGHHSN